MTPAFKAFLEKKGAEYALFDPKRFPKVYKEIKKHLKQKPYTVQLIGTNGKGTTGRFIADFLHEKRKTVLHFTSPHIEDLNERFWQNGVLADDRVLERIHKKIISLIDEKTLEAISYFEYLNLIALFLAQGYDFLVLEAGLGGEFDSTTSCEPDLAVVTKVGVDHQEFLGETIEEISTTKLNGIKGRAVIGLQKYEEVETITETLGKKNGFTPLFVSRQNDNLKDFVRDGEPEFLAENRVAAFYALQTMGFKLLSADLKANKMPGRVEKIKNNIYIDVGHNIEAAAVLKDFFQGKKVILIFNSYKEKDFYGVLKTLKSVVKKVLYLEVKEDRIALKSDIKKACKEVGLEIEDLSRLDEKETYLVFGSFSTVREFITFYSKWKI